MVKDRRTARCADCGAPIRPDSYRCRTCEDRARLAGSTRLARSCADCGVGIDWRSTRCRPCSRRARALREGGTCIDCGARIQARSRRCRPCDRRARGYRGPNACADCGVPVTRARSTRCAPCAHLAQRTIPPCAECGGRQTHRNKSGLCGGCFKAALHERTVQSGRDILWDFDARHWRWVVTEWAGYEIADLARRIDAPVTSLRAWLSGYRKPERSEWEKVERFLCLEPCPRCMGAGSIDRTVPRQPHRLSQSERRRNKRDYVRAWRARKREEAADAIA